MKKALFVATVARQHIIQFHLPYLQMLQEMGYEVHVAAKNDLLNKSDRIPFCDHYFDVPFERNPLKPGNVKAYKMLKNIIKTEKYDIIHCHTPVGGVLTRLVTKNIRRHDPTWITKVIYTAHGFHFYKGAPLINWMVYYPVEKHLSRYTDVLITINQEDYARAVNKFSAKKTFLVNGVGVDLEKFAHPTKSQKELRAELAIAEDAIVIISIGELNKNKNHRAVINSLSEISTEKNVVYMIAGIGDMSADLKALAVERNIDLRLLGYRKDVPNLLSISQIFAFPSFREGLSLSMMEAMASGKAIIASQIRGNCDLITSGQNGFLFDPINGNADLEEGLQSLIEDETLRKNFGERAKESVQSYSLVEVKKVMKKIYES